MGVGKAICPGLYRSRLKYIFIGMSGIRKNVNRVRNLVADRSSRRAWWVPEVKGWHPVGAKPGVAEVCMG